MLNRHKNIDHNYLFYLYQSSAYNLQCKYQKNLNEMFS